MARIPDTVPSPSVSAWRNAWRPDRVRVLLVAESHVAAAEDDEKVSVDASEYTDRKLPDDYVRLVYCLGYGEDTLCTPQAPENPGTRQFWDLLGQVARGLGEVQPRKAASTASRRIRWKIKTLEILEQRGIWLVDASVTPLYHPGGRRPLQGKQYRKAVQDSWQRFVWPEVRADLPAQIWIIGYGVYDALDGLPELRNAKVIDQPQSRLIERYSSTLRTLVNDCQRVVGDDAN